MNRLAILLVHGFSGSECDLFRLAEKLRRSFGSETVQMLRLPGHAEGKCPTEFDSERLLAVVVAPLKELRQNVETLVVLGHSTGGNLLLAALELSEVVPDLLVLAATPFRVDLAYLDRWQRHRLGQDELSLTTVAGLVKMINSIAENMSVPACPALLLQGGADRLVLPEEAQRWQELLAGTAELYELPESGHQLFQEQEWEKAAEAVESAVGTVLNAEEKWQIFDRRLLATEPEAATYLAAYHAERRHLAMSPGGRRLLGDEVELPELVPWNPVFANIEITTSCNLRCRHCARSLLHPPAQQMSVALFEQLLEKVPSAYRVTLVGLGEPLLHPQLAELISLAKKLGRRVGLVTNAQLLTPRRSAEILEAGLDSIAFSLDTVNPILLAELRAGSELALIESNIRAFCTQAEQLARPVSRAVFCALSAATLDGLEALIDKVAEFGVHVLMLSDLNFPQNRADSLNANISLNLEKTVRRMVAYGFAKKLPILGVRSLEDFGLAQNYREALLLPVEQLYRRSERHRHCFSLWQTLSINVNGELCLCDCQPERKLGNLQQQSLASIWNGSALREQRQRMLCDQPAPECLSCPRF